MFEAEDYSFAVGEKVGPEVRFTVARHLSFVRTVGIHHPDFEHGRSNQVLFQQTRVVGFCFIRFRVMSAIDDLLAVVRPEWTTIVTEFVRQAPHVLAVGIHRVDVEIAIAHRREDKLLAVQRDRCFCVVARRVGQLLQIGAVRFGSENVETRIHGPNVSARKVRLWRTLLVAEMR